MWIDITDKNRDEFNKLATHPLQSFEWGEFRKKTGIRVIRRGFTSLETSSNRAKQNGRLIDAFQLTLHPISHTSWTIGYVPKGTMPTKEIVEELKKIGKENNCIFIQLEPNMKYSSQLVNYSLALGLCPAAHPLFTKNTLEIDLTKPEEELLKNMHPKARYNIKVAQKHNVTVEEENTDKAFDIFWKLTEETTTRQHFFAHTKAYHLAQWKTLPHKQTPNTLSSHLLFAKYNNMPLTAWIVFIFHKTLYYPYGASSQEHREVMHSTSIMWEAIRFGKKHQLTSFDLWGAAPLGVSSSDPWFGFTQFKERFGSQRVEFIGSYDLVINPLLYEGYKIADKLRWLLLSLRK